MAKKSVIIKQVKSSIKASKRQKASLVGLGLRKIGMVKELEDTSSVRGMIDSVAHLIEIVQDKKNKEKE